VEPVAATSVKLQNTLSVLETAYAMQLRITSKMAPFALSAILQTAASVCLLTAVLSAVQAPL